MRLGIDFGTTRIVVALVDRGNYPVITFETPEATAREWFPPLVAARGERRLYGWDAWAAQQEPGWTIIRSLKRALEAAGPETRVEIAEQALPMRQLLAELAAALRQNLLERSSLPPPGKEPLEVMLGVPANANSNQRFLTTEAFREAGFEVLGLLNEPSAASIEFGHRDRAARLSKEKAMLLVYDLGGGTFDVSLVELDDLSHSVIASDGISTLGGDDFDGILAELALDAAGLSEAERDSLTQAETFRLWEECREKKESLHPNTRRVAIDLGLARNGWPEVSLAVTDFYEHCRPAIEETLHATEDLLAAHGFSPSDSTGSDGLDAEARLEALYVTGGGSELPVVARLLREVFGRRVKRSACARSATAIGLAIQADAEAGYLLREKFTRYFGVWREAEGGRAIIFDPLFRRGTPLPHASEPPLTSARRYSPVHNIGHFRYLECNSLAANGRPAGDITFWDDIRFPFDPSLQANEQLADVPVAHYPPATTQEIEESYSCDASGAVTVTISNLTAGYTRKYRLGRWAASSAPIVPGRRKRKSVH